MRAIRHLGLLSVSVIAALALAACGPPTFSISTGDPTCVIPSGGTREFSINAQSNVNPGAKVQWRASDGTDRFSPPEGLTTQFTAPEVTQDTTINIDADMVQDGRLYSADTLRCLITAPAGIAVVEDAPTQEPTPAPEAPTPAPEEPTPAPEAPTPAPEAPTPAPTAEIDSALYRITVVKPSGRAFGDRGKGMQTAVEIFREALASGPLRDLGVRLAALGITLEIVVEDDAGDPDLAVEVANRVVNDGVTRCVVGHYRSSTSVAAGDIYSAEQHRMLAITPASTNPGVTDGRPTVWRLVSTDLFQGSTGYSLASDQLAEGTKILIVRLEGEDAYSDGLEAQFRDSAPDQNLILPDPATFVQPPNELPDFTAAVERIRQETEPIGLFYFIGSDEELGAFLKKLNEGDERFSSTPVVGVSLMDNIGEIAKLREQYNNSITYTALAVPADESLRRMAPWFIERFRGINRTLPTAYAAETYDGVYICARAIEEAAVLADREGRDPLALAPADVSAAMPFLVNRDSFIIPVDPAREGSVAGPYLLSSDSRELKVSLLFVQAEDGAVEYTCDVICTPN